MSIGLRVDFGQGIKDRKKKIIADSDERNRVERRVGVSPVTHRPLSSLAQKNILASELPWGEKGGPLSWWTGCGTRGAFRSLWFQLFPPLSLCLHLFPLFFVSLIGLTDHKLSRQSEGGGDQYCSETKQSFGGKTLKMSKLIFSNRGKIKENETETYFEDFNIHFADAQMNPDSNVVIIRSVWLETNKSINLTRRMPEFSADLLCDWCRQDV